MCICVNPRQKERVWTDSPDHRIKVRSRTEPITTWPWEGIWFVSRWALCPEIGTTLQAMR